MEDRWGAGAAESPPDVNSELVVENVHSLTQHNPVTHTRETGDCQTFEA